ncbi:MAG: NAD(P)H-dependent glycerol-3-phosphate dehydrogenase [Coriobacteriales bacterium]|nr:NAD(P)H-dependent glycerol-3-phosphate dehydrogenase [Coriobacteriales bacterium]
MLHVSNTAKGAPLAKKVAVIGSGSWGTAVTSLVSPQAQEVVVWSFEQEVADGINNTRHNPVQLPDFEFPKNVRATTSLQTAAQDAEALLLVVPSAFLRQTCARLAPFVANDVPVLVLTKGVERGTGNLMATVVAQELGNENRIAVLSGPNHAEEISQGTISAAVVASKSQDVAKYFQSMLVCPAFRVYVTEDLEGVEICAAEKNVIAIACGIAVALGAGDNTLAVLMTRGLAEVSRIAVAVGANPLTCMGLAGMGDLVVTCTSRHSRNRSFGEAFVRGESLDAYQRRTGMIVEGAEAARSIWELAVAHGVQAPITKVVYDLLFEGLPLSNAVEALIERTPVVEFYGVGQQEATDKVSDGASGPSHKDQ